MTVTHVYHLVDPVDRVVRYVGKTASPKARLKAHIAESVERQNTAKKQWIHGLLQRGLQPVLVIAETHADEAAARQAESRHCHLHLATIHNIHDPAKGEKDLRRGQPHAPASA